jgi:ketosteroid isomerase-like protein
MSQENVDTEEALRVAFHALNQGDLDGFLDLIDPEVEFTSMIAEAEGETFHGHEGVKRWWELVRNAFTDVRWDYLVVQADADRGVTKVLIEGTLGGVQVGQTMWQATVARDGKAIWWGFFRTEAEALEAVGLSG